MQEDQSPALVTIGISCYNAVDTVERAWNSALAQDWPNTEIVIVDDASSDESELLLRELIGQKRNARLLCHANNRGFPGSLNTIIQHAQGQYIAIFDDDDRSRPDRISRQIRRINEFEMRSNSRLNLCFGGRTVIPEGQAVPTQIWEGIGNSPPEPSGILIAEYLLGLNGSLRGSIGAGTMLARREVFSTIGLFDETIRRGDGWDYAIRIGLKGGRCISVAGPVVDTFKTHTADKGGRIALDMHLALIRKYRDHYKTTASYLSAHASARCRFYGNMRRIFQARTFRLFELMLSPRKIWKP